MWYVLGLRSSISWAAECLTLTLCLISISMEIIPSPSMKRPAEFLFTLTQQVFIGKRQVFIGMGYWENSEFAAEQN